MVKNLALSLASLFLVLVFGEWLFPKFLGKLPLRLYGFIDKDLRILAQSSKKNLLPKEYIAILGDSYAVGAGDWLEEVRENNFWGSPDYSPAHLIHKKTGLDVVSFGRGGAGSFDGIWAEPVTQFLHINSVKDYHLSLPKYFLIFFYEGNDIFDNLALVKDFQATGKGTGDKIKLARFKDFLDAKFKEAQNGNFERSFWKNMLFTRSILRGVSNLVEEWTASSKKLRIYPKTPNNIALIDAKNVPLQTHLQAPPLFGLRSFEKKTGLTNESLKGAVYVFEQSLARLAAFFPQSEIKIVFIPSPLSSYKMTSSHVVYRGYMGWINMAETTVIEKKHVELCETIKEIASAHNTPFINTTKSLRKASSMEIIHGPSDWDHFNKRGYQVLSDDLAEVLIQPVEDTRTDACVY